MGTTNTHHHVTNRTQRDKSKLLDAHPSHQAHAGTTNTHHHVTNHTQRDKSELLDAHPSHQVHVGTEKTQPGTDI